MASLYQRCATLKEKLLLVPGFFLFLKEAESTLTSQAFSPLQRPDPVTLLWGCFRLGYSLTYLLNYLYPGTVKPIQSTSNVNKANVYHFIVACRNTLKLKEEDLFSISDLYKDDSNALVKVLNTVEKLVELLEKEGKLDQSKVQAASTRIQQRMSIGPKTNQDRVLQELLESERKYVADLELLQNYMNQLKLNGIVSDEVLSHIFGNLNQLLDFQRKFLIKLEDCCLMPIDRQQIGTLFLQNEQNFAIYGPYCANYRNATEHAMKNAEQLQTLEKGLEPNYELPSYLIKPVQRICKYPLLLREMIKNSDGNNESYKLDLQEGNQAISRVTDYVNELRRKEENVHIVADLEKNIDDWKGFQLNDFGELQLDANVLMSRRNIEKDVHLYLFENIIICCTETKKEKKLSLGFSRKSSTSMIYRLKGGVPITTIEGLVPNPRTFELKVFYKDSENQEMESFILKFLNQEPLKAWHQQIEKLVNMNKRRSAPANPQEQRKRSESQPFPKNHSVVMPQAISFDANDISRLSLTSNARTSASSTKRESQSVTLPTLPENQASLPHPPPRQISSLVHSSSTSTGITSTGEKETIKNMDQTSTGIPSSGKKEIINNLDQSSFSGKKDLINNLDQAMNELGAALKEDFTEDAAKHPPLPPPLVKPAVPIPPANAPPARPNMSNLPRPKMANLPVSLLTQPPFNQTPQPLQPLENEEKIKLKIHHKEDIFVVFIETSTNYQQLVMTISEKLSTKEELKLKYQDEDGDHITIRSNEDIQVAMKLASATRKNPVLNVFVN